MTVGLCIAVGERNGVGIDIEGGMLVVDGCMLLLLLRDRDWVMEECFCCG